MAVTFTLPSVGLLNPPPPRPVHLPQIHPPIPILNNTVIHLSRPKRLRVSFCFLDKHQRAYVPRPREEFQASLCCKMRCIPLFPVTFLLCLGYLLYSRSSWFLYSTRGEKEHQSPSLPLNFSSPCCFPKDVHAAKYILDYEELADLYRFVLLIWNSALPQQRLPVCLVLIIF